MNIYLFIFFFLLTLTFIAGIIHALVYSPLVFLFIIFILFIGAVICEK